MKNFLIKFALFTAFWAILFTIVYIKLPRKFYSRDDYELVTTVHAKIHSNGLKGNILLGDSKTLYGFNANAAHALNFCMGAETPIEGYYELRAILNNPTNKIDTVFLSYTHRHFISQECFYLNSYYYNVIDSKYLDSARAIAASYHDQNYRYDPGFSLLSLFPTLNTPANNQKKDLIIHFVSGVFNDLPEYYKKKRYANLPSADNQLRNGRLITYPTDTLKYDRNVPAVDEDMSYIKPSEVNLIYFKKMLALCQSHHVPVLFIQMPSLPAKQTPTLNRHIAYLKSLLGRNFIQDTTFYADSEFRDYYAHLNANGAKRYQNFFQQKLYHLTK